jgi:hypothetical protein
VAEVSVNVAAKDPEEVTNPVSLAAREVPVFCCTSA